jgi:hypothetical protein
LIKNTGALPLGLASEREMLIVELNRALTGELSDWMARLSDCLPRGMEVADLESVATAKMPRVQSVLYKLGLGFSGGESVLAAALERFQSGLTATGLHREKPLDLYAESLDSYMQAGELFLRLKAQPSGSTVSPYAAFGLLLGMDPEDLRSEPLGKEDFSLQTDAPRALAKESA